MATSAATEHDSGAGKVKQLTVRIKSFYSDVRSEMKKVTVPSWKDVQSTTLVVLVTVAIFGAFFYVVDLILTKAMNALIIHFSH